MEKIIVFDVETPNHKNDRICSIGLTVVENGEVSNSHYYLVNPECFFNDRNTQIHGITQSDIADAPTFPEIWDKIGAFFRENLVAAHNATFDLCVLRKVLQGYGINETLIYYVDTLTMARSIIKEAENYRLPTLCNKIGIPLNQHNAASDSQACAKLLCWLLNNTGAELERYIKSFDLNTVVSTEQKDKKISVESQSLLTLSGILTGITCDNLLTEAEVEYLKRWMENNTNLKGNYPYDKIFSTLESALSDGILEQTELNAMLRLFKQVTDPVNEYSCKCESLVITGKSICLSGEFNYGSKAKVGEKLISYGASIHSSVRNKTDILLVGGQGSSAWSAGKYGSKVKKALELQEKGFNIQIMREADFFSALEE